MNTLPGFLTGRRHSISGNCHRPNFGLGSPEFSTLNAEETPLFPTFEQADRRGESLTRSASQKKRSKALSFGDLSKRVFDISCSDACQMMDSLPKATVPDAEIEESSEHTGQGNNHKTQIDEVKVQLEGENVIPSNALPLTQSRESELPSSESHEDDKSKTEGNARCVGKSPSL